ncbi:uncharacterized protein LOC143214212 [Lasioglossum baleicum]|uniref:uncharacterized protein LOC143214212 n=1 Tax=Lasioglossum baleicum TaxID=434251 RepID=UPI003FCDDDBD
MAAKFEDVMLEQEAAMRSLVRVLLNVKKLGQNNFTVAKLQQRREFLKDAYAQCREIDRRLQAFRRLEGAEKVAYFKDEQFSLCEDEHHVAADFIADHIDKLQKSGPASSAPTMPAAAQSRSDLPRIGLPTFSGEPTKWESFRDKFTSLIINDESLSDVKRLHHLNSCVKGEAENLICNLPVTDANFKIAWDTLVQRFDNKRDLIQEHLKTLYSLPHASDASELRSLRDKAHKTLQALRNLERPVDTWDDMIVYLLVSRLDRSSRKAWELKLGESTEYPTYADLDKFIATRIRALGALQSIPKQSKRVVQTHVATSNRLSRPRDAPLVCSLCKTEHLLNACPLFKSKTTSQRFDFVKGERRCLNCLSQKHSVNACPSKYACQKCGRRHHTLLHFDSTPNRSDVHDPSSSPASPPSTSNQVALHVSSHTAFATPRILLATAWVIVTSVAGRRECVRALLDQGSATTLMTESLAQRLRVPRRRVSVAITGIGNREINARHAATIEIASKRGTGPTLSTTALILTSLTRYVPERSDQSISWHHTRDLDLADENPTSSDPIDLIIGADLYGFILVEGLRAGSMYEPIAQNSIFGWFLSGPAGSTKSTSYPVVPIYHCSPSDPLDLDLRRFWEIVEIPTTSHFTDEEQECEHHFRTTHKRDSSGRYVVRLPFKRNPPSDLGHSYRIAERMLSKLELRLQPKPKLYAEYDDFLREYLQLGHMRKLPPSSIDAPHAVYIPHHAVIRDSSATTHLRVVFNASSLTSNGTSLNDHLLIGPKHQTDLPTIILRCRQYRYVLTSDITKMYRQILVDPQDVDYQRILWRSSPSEPIGHYQLLTVTYGTAPAPFLALRVLQQLIEDEGSQFPLATRVLQHHLYVDDCVFGAFEDSTLIEARNQLIALLSKAHFRLHKWTSNASHLLADISPHDHGIVQEKILQSDDTVKVLGVAWSPEVDAFRFKVTLPSDAVCTKRAVLSNIARLFDPLGWVTPTTVYAKILMQQLWVQKCSWDSPLPPVLLERWERYRLELPVLNSLSISRWTHQDVNISSCQLHGFTDASTLAYAAAVYLRLVTSSGQIVISLLAAKSKVAPVKPLTVPRLELSAALLLTHLVVFIRQSLHELPENVPFYCWTDSTITLCWLRQPASKWKTFVANRVAQINSTLPDAIWRHVPSEENPADCKSRGLLPSQLLAHDLWWTGPSWLKLSTEHWPCNIPEAPSGTITEERPTIPVNLCPARTPWELRDRFSSWPKLLKVTAVIVHAHLRALHAGSQLTLSILRQEYWMLRARPTVRNVLHKCVKCAREKAAPQSALMGELPDFRVTRSARAFVHCGLDYAGPIQTPYNRFCSRRGIPSALYSDNGTTFRGADRELASAFRAATRDPTTLNRLALDRVTWHFTPPSAPHFGGLWEAGVRSVKYHLKRVVGAHTLTFEEFATLLCQVEACLNSRPLAAVSENFDDYCALTPGHFLIGAALTAVPNPSLLDLKEARLSRWQLCQQMTESFWRRWSQDYMQGLQQRVKWQTQKPNIVVGQLVLLRQSNLPPCKWELGRVIECHPGDDGIVRVVTVKTAQSQYKRPIVKLCILPIDLPSEPPYPLRGKARPVDTVPVPSYALLDFAGKTDYTSPKAYRPICLTPSLLVNCFQSVSLLLRGGGKILLRTPSYR